MRKMDANARIDRRLLVRNIKGFFLAASFLGLAACSVPTIVEFTNATTRAITLQYSDEQHQLVNVVLTPGGQIEIKKLLNRNFSIANKEIRYEYVAQDIPEAFVEDVGFGPFFKRVVKVQIENDGCIYINNTKQKELNRGSVQPDGFPLCPKK